MQMGSLVSSKTQASKKFVLDPIGRLSLLACAALLTACADPIGIAISAQNAAFEARETPEGAHAAPADYRLSSCTSLARDLILMESGYQTSSGFQQKVYGWHVASIRQVQQEKSCSTQQAGAPQSVPSPSAAPNAPQTVEDPSVAYYRKLDCAGLNELAPHQEQVWLQMDRKNGPYDEPLASIWAEEKDRQRSLMRAAFAQKKCPGALM